MRSCHTRRDQRDVLTFRELGDETRWRIRIKLARILNVMTVSQGAFNRAMPVNTEAQF